MLLEHKALERHSHNKPSLNPHFRGKLTVIILGDWGDIYIFTGSVSVHDVALAEHSRWHHGMRLISASFAAYGES